MPLPVRHPWAQLLKLKVIGAAVTFLISGLILAGDPVSAEEPGSLENLWSEPSSSEPVNVSPWAPMCTFDAFKQSELVLKGGWPGVGPFTASAGSPYEMSDKSQNKLRIKVLDNKVTEAQISLLKEKPASQDFLDMQMTANFLLEAVGLKSKTIADFNKELVKNKETVLSKSSVSPVQLPAGRYLVNIQRQSASGAPAVTYQISVNSKEASKDALMQHSVGAGEAPSPNAAPTPGDSGVTTSTEPASTSAQESAAALKDTFQEVIRNWQQVKKVAVRQRQTAQLSEVLAGKALAKQTDAVKWLANNHKYYDMVPKMVIVDRFAELLPGKKYAVYAQVREASKYIDEASGQTIKETEDTYKVNYTIEKAGDRWLITDSSLVTSSIAPQAVRPSAGKMSR